MTPKVSGFKSESLSGFKLERMSDFVGIRTYEKGIRIKKAEMKLLDIEGDAFHPEWNYTIKPRIPTET